MACTCINTTRRSTRRIPGRSAHRLTVNYGLRWEPYLSNINKTGQLDHFDQSTQTSGFWQRLHPACPVWTGFRHDPQYKCANGYNCSDYNKFFPRMGIVLDRRGNGKMTIRASYGIFGDRLHQFFPNQMGFGPPFGNNIGISNVSLSNPMGELPRRQRDSLSCEPAAQWVHARNPIAHSRQRAHTSASIQTTTSRCTSTSGTSAFSVKSAIGC